jgi:hypothetical protein
MYLIFNIGVAMPGAAKASATDCFQTLFTVIPAYFLLGEQLHIYHAGGIAPHRNRHHSRHPGNAGKTEDRTRCAMTGDVQSGSACITALNSGVPFGTACIAAAMIPRVLWHARLPR